MVIAPISPAQSLATQAYEHIKAAIIAGEIRPDHLYSVQQFAQQLGVSRTPVREALLALARDGLLYMDRNRGFHLVTITQRDLDEVIDLRLLLEVPAMRQVAARDPLPTDVLKRARDIYPKLDAAAHSSDLLEFLSLDRSFHLTLLEGAGNRRLVSLVGDLRDHMHLPGLREMAAHGQLYRAHQDHLALLEALESGDADAAARIMTAHLERTRKEWHQSADSSDAPEREQATPPNTSS